MRNIHIISHTHWDREWYRTFQQFRLRLIHLIDGLLDILEKDKEFKHFMLDGQTIVLDDYLLMRPEKEEILRQHIRKGRILIGPWHILPDMFLVGPESHIRNLLQGDRTARKFGPKMMIGYIPDPFGHPGQVPQILHGFGIDTACLWRGVDETATEFHWRGPDGSRVLMAYLRDGYGNGAELPADDLERFASMLAERGASLAANSATTDLLIMYGTDHMEPPHNTSEAIANADEMLRDSHVIHSTLPQYIAAIKSSLARQKTNIPEVFGELRACRRMHLLPGVLSTRMWIKQRNHASETLLTRWAEPFSTWQEIVTGPQSTILDKKEEIIRQAWRLLMENHPHDSICGCSVDQVHNEMKVRFDQVDQVGEELTRQSLETLAAGIQTHSSVANAQFALVVFNPTSRARTDLVEIALELPPGVNEFAILDEDGNPLPHQEHGVGSHELIHMTLDPKGLQSAFGNISDGRAAGMTVQDIKIRRAGADVTIEAIVADGGEPDLANWHAGVKKVEELLADGSITTYHIRARSASATRIAITVPHVPGLGYRTLWARSRESEGKTPIHVSSLLKPFIPLGRLPIVQNLARRKRYARPPYKIENDYFIVEALRDGTLTLQDKQTDKRYPGLNKFQDGGDCGDEYNYAPPALDRITAPRLKRVLIARGPVQQTLTLELELKSPAALSSDRKARSRAGTILPITTIITLTNGVPRVDIRSTLNNTARDHRLRVHFPAPFAAQSGHHDGHFEVVERPIGVPAYDENWIEQPRPEVPQRAFTSVSDGRNGLTIANRGLPEVEVIKNSAGNAEVALTLLRCVGWLSRDDFSTRKGHAGPAMETPEAQMPGNWNFEYTIIPHTGDWRNAAAQAYAFEVPMRAVRASLHDGKLPSTGSFVRVTPDSFVVSAVKRAEDESGWLVRGYNLTGEDSSVTLTPWRAFKRINRINLAEEHLSALKQDKNGRMTFPLRGHEIVTIKFED